MADHVENDPSHLWHMAEHFELEGIMAKEAASVYSRGRTTRWLKIKTDIGEEREKAHRP